MTHSATFIAPPIYEAEILGEGVFAIKITARKVYGLSRDSQIVASRFYKGVDQVGKLAFADLVRFVKGGAK